LNAGNAHPTKGLSSPSSATTGEVKSVNAPSGRTRANSVRAVACTLGCWLVSEPNSSFTRLAIYVLVWRITLG